MYTCMSMFFKIKWCVYNETFSGNMLYFKWLLTEINSTRMSFRLRNLGTDRASQKCQEARRAEKYVRTESIRQRPNAVSMLAQRLWHRLSIDPALGGCLVFAGQLVDFPMAFRVIKLEMSISSASWSLSVTATRQWPWWQEPSKYETLHQCWRNVGAPSATLARHYVNIGWASLVCWESDDLQYSVNVAFCTIIAISRQQEPRSRDYTLLLFQMTKRVCCSIFCWRPLWEICIKDKLHT